MILDSCYNLSYHQLEFQIQDRISFLSVLALSLDDTLPEAKSIWFFRPQLTGFSAMGPISAPKGHLNAANEAGTGYREVNWSLPRVNSRYTPVKTSSTEPRPPVWDGCSSH